LTNTSPTQPARAEQEWVSNFCEQLQKKDGDLSQTIEEMRQSAPMLRDTLLGLQHLEEQKQQINRNPEEGSKSAEATERLEL
jgi:hypothetical protein